MPLYISGPMSGLPEFNYPAFQAAAKELRERGYEVVNPADIKVDTPSWEAFMRADIAALVNCDVIYMLSGYKASKGALLELTIAEALGMSVMYQ